MKRTIALLLTIALCLLLCACGGSTKAAYKDSKEAFDHVATAYLAVNAFSEDIYEAWRLGVNERSDYDDSYEFSSFAAEMNIEQTYIEQAVSNLLFEETFDTELWEDLPYFYGNSYFSAWVSAISEAYECSGDAEAIREELNTAKNLMKQLGDDYSDYEHYPSLKKFFTNTLAFLDFCCNPEGSFEQVVETFNTYRNNAREYFFDLNYVFGDSIDGFHSVGTSDTETEAEETIEAATDTATSETT